MSKLKIAVLVSGNGTNLQALIDKIEEGYMNAEISVVVSNRENAYGLTRACKHNIRTETVDIKARPIKKDRNKELMKVLDETNVELIVLAGFLEIISDEIIDKYENKIINIHPSLIPSFAGKGYYGEKVHKEVIKSGVKITGATVHFVNKETDGGPIIMQESVSVDFDDNLSSVKQKVLNIEHEILPLTVKLIAEGKIEVIENRVNVKP
ncbi:MAG: phosphoribosylglycinamide formyltransferase [Alkaliphilus sp.]|jgi:phosphoribosylglycinamide formyltransferase-1|nr:phosphoribosylglycinamide formyltransferase [bacterium AH-315-L21]MBN4063033.1 phosphoribosylglycinamide formyltransferase [Alkaliphilus sp. AH-315-G20]MBN4067597.1 phosphoribosylglycinamide formyltransferase [Alkaliphilus transvaalensis]PHS33890.1 MAG: phosphoribosylglycinamide formyltransferase [Alkaliphilus sp.]